MPQVSTINPRDGRSREPLIWTPEKEHNFFHHLFLSFSPKHIGLGVLQELILSALKLVCLSENAIWVGMKQIVAEICILTVVCCK